MHLARLVQLFWLGASPPSAAQPTYDPMSTVVIEHDRNKAYELVVALRSSSDPSDFKAGLTPTVEAWHRDGAGVWTSFVPAKAIAEVGASGLYHQPFPSDELNHDSVLVKFSDVSAYEEAFLFNLQSNYWADVSLTIDDDAGADEYVVTWMRDTQIVASADITVGPFIKTFDSNSGAALIPITAMNAIGTTDRFRHAETTKRIVLGDAVIAEVTATIDGNERRWSSLISRDHKN